MRFLAKETVDSRMYELQQEKLQETQGLIQEFQADRSMGPSVLRMILGKAWYDEEADDDEACDDEGDESGECVSESEHDNTQKDPDFEA